MSDIEEHLLGTDPSKADTDGDGPNDGDEVALGTDPKKADTDGDGDSDGDEVAYGSDPKLFGDTLDDHRPVTPVLDMHAGEVPLSGLTLTATTFDDPDAGNTLGKDQWQFSWNNIFTELFLDRTRSSNEALNDGATLPVPNGLLQPGGIGFWVRLRHSDNLGLWSHWSDPVMYSIPDMDPDDLDQDGWPDADQVVGFTDLDGNGTDDSLQEMQRVYDAEQGSAVGFMLNSAPAGSAITTLAPVPLSDIPSPPLPGILPYGLFSYSVDFPLSYIIDPENPETIEIRMLFSDSIPEGTTWFQYDPVTDRVLDVSAEVSVVGNQAILSVTDGLSGDLDGLVNARIIDPISPVFPDADTDEDTIPDSQDNCTYRANLNQADRGGVNSSVPDGIGDACQCGDQNADGMVTNTDAVLIQRHILGLSSPFNADLCDVNGDGNCTNTDAVIVKRAVLGLPPGVGQGCAAAVPVF